MVADAFRVLGLPAWALEVYTDNPITLAVLGFRKAFWGAGTDADYPDDLLLRTTIAALVGLVLLFISHRVFTRLQGNFAQEM
jgi:ABC-2 type transport system permease protein